jgi:hypothetical protein
MASMEGILNPYYSGTSCHINPSHVCSYSPNFSQLHSPKQPSKRICIHKNPFYLRFLGAGIAAGIATRYGLEGAWIESRWGEFFRTYPDRLRGPHSLLYNGYWVFPGGKGGRGVMLTTHPLLVPRLRKSWAIPPLTLWVLLCLLRGSLYPLYLHFLLLYTAWIRLNKAETCSWLRILRRIMFED